MKNRNIGSRYSGVFGDVVFRLNPRLFLDFCWHIWKPHLSHVINNRCVVTAAVLIMMMPYPSVNCSGRFFRLSEVKRIKLATISSSRCGKHLVQFKLVWNGDLVRYCQVVRVHVGKHCIQFSVWVNGLEIELENFDLVEIWQLLPGIISIICLGSSFYQWILKFLVYLLT